VKKFTLIVLVWIASMQSSSSQTPRTVDLGISNIPQEQSNWCWAAVAQQIIQWRQGSSPTQCALVGEALNAQACCQSPHKYNRSGSMQQVQQLIASYGAAYSSMRPPATALDLHKTLEEGKAVIVFIRTTPTVGHLIVVRGMSWLRTRSAGRQPYLFVNDPLAYFTEPVAFARLLPLWRDAIVVN
jgi:hypothetical protein